MFFFPFIINNATSILNITMEHCNTDHVFYKDSKKYLYLHRINYAESLFVYKIIPNRYYKVNQNVI